MTKQSLFVLLAFFINTIGPFPVQADEFVLPRPGILVHLSPEYNPPILKGIKVHPDDPFRFDFILDQGDGISGNPKTESIRLIKYFLASLTIPEKDLWVNLSPYEKNRIVPESFGQTEMGRDLLAEDYMLKQITASLIYPEDEIGKKFWKRIYEESAKRFGTTNIPVNTFNKVWIVPEKAIVYENVQAGTAYVVESKLKVMLEQDYLSLSKHGARGVAEGGETRGQDPDMHSLGSQVIREIIIPELTKEVNEGKNFTQLRQVYNSLILAAWYKKKIKDSILARVYDDKKKVAGVEYKDDTDVELIYQRYLQAFKKGAYNYIKEEVDPITQETIPRKYFSGGASLYKVDAAMSIVNDQRLLPDIVHAMSIAVQLNPQMPLSGPFRTLNPQAKTKIVTTFLEDEDQEQVYAMDWTIKDTSFNIVGRYLRLVETIEKEAEEASKANRDVVVVELGAGNGRAIKELAQQLRKKGINNFHLFGVSSDYYQEWLSFDDPNVTIIWGDYIQLEEYFKPGTVDFMYSYFGHPSRYLSQIATVLRDGGKMVYSDYKQHFPIQPASGFTFEKVWEFLGDDKPEGTSNAIVIEATKRNPAPLAQENKTGPGDYAMIGNLPQWPLPAPEQRTDVFDRHMASVIIKFSQIMKNLMFPSTQNINMNTLEGLLKFISEFSYEIHAQDQVLPFIAQFRSEFVGKTTNAPSKVGLENIFYKLNLTLVKYGWLITIPIKSYAFDFTDIAWERVDGYAIRKNSEGREIIIVVVTDIKAIGGAQHTSMVQPDSIGGAHPDGYIVISKSAMSDLSVARAHLDDFEKVLKDKKSSMDAGLQYLFNRLIENVKEAQYLTYERKFVLVEEWVHQEDMGRVKRALKNAPHLSLVQQTEIILGDLPSNRFFRSVKSHWIDHIKTLDRTADGNTYLHAAYELNAYLKKLIYAQTPNDLNFELCRIAYEIPEIHVRAEGFKRITVSLPSVYVLEGISESLKSAVSLRGGFFEKVQSILKPDNAMMSGEKLVEALKDALNPKGYEANNNDSSFIENTMRELFFDQDEYWITQDRESSIQRFLDILRGYIQGSTANENYRKRIEQIVTRIFKYPFHVGQIPRLLVFYKFIWQCWPDLGFKLMEQQVQHLKSILGDINLGKDKYNHFLVDDFYFQHQVKMALEALQELVQHSQIDPGIAQGFTERIQALNDFGDQPVIKEIKQSSNYQVVLGFQARMLRHLTQYDKWYKQEISALMSSDTNFDQRRPIEDTTEMEPGDLIALQGYNTVPMIGIVTNSVFIHNHTYVELTGIDGVREITVKGPGFIEIKYESSPKAIENVEVFLKKLVISPSKIRRNVPPPVVDDSSVGLGQDSQINRALDDLDSIDEPHSDDFSQDNAQLSAIDPQTLKANEEHAVLPDAVRVPETIDLGDGYYLKLYSKSRTRYEYSYLDSNGIIGGALKLAWDQRTYSWRPAPGLLGGNHINDTAFRGKILGTKAYLVLIKVFGVLASSGVSSRSYTTPAAQRMWERLGAGAKIEFLGSDSVYPTDGRSYVLRDNATPDTSGEMAQVISILQEQGRIFSLLTSIGGSVDVWKTDDIPFVLKIPKVNGERIWEELVSKYYICQKRLNGLVPKAYLAYGLQVNLEGERMTIPKVIVQKRIMTLENKLMELAIQNTEESNKQVRTIIAQWWALQIAMWKRGVLDEDIKILDNYGYDETEKKVLLLDFSHLSTNVKDFQRDAEDSVLDKFNILNISALRNVAGENAAEAYVDFKLSTLELAGYRVSAPNEISVAVWGSDPAQVSSPTGGIDLTPAQMNLQTKIDPSAAPQDDRGMLVENDAGIKFHLDPAMLAQLQSATGFVPVIINIQPLSDLKSFLGVV